MKLDELREKLERAGIRVWVDGEKLRYKAPQNALTPELLDALRANKSALIAVLTEESEVEAGDLERIPRTGRIPLSFAQERLWYLHELDSESTAYNEFAAYRLRGPLDREALTKSMQYIVNRHESLRTTFAEYDGIPIQSMSPEFEITIKHAKVSNGERGAVEKAQAFVQLPFDLKVVPPLRMLLIELGERDHIFVFVAHHIVMDGWSAGVLNRNLQLAYDAHTNGRDPQLPELKYQYADYADWERRIFDSPAGQQKLAHWRERLQAPRAPLDLPTDRPRPEVQRYPGKRLRFEFGETLSDDINRLSRQLGSSPFMTLLTAFAILFHRFSDQDDILIGYPTANRNSEGTEELIGCFMNTLVHRTRFAGSETFREVLAETRRTALEDYANQDVPFARVVQELNPPRDQSRNPLFQAAFSYLNMAVEAPKMTGLEVSDFDLDRGTAMLDVTLFVREQSGVFSGWLEFNTDLFDAERAQDMANALRAILAAAIADPDVVVGKIDLLDDSMRNQIIREWNKTAFEYPADTPLHGLVERQVDATPDNVAVIASGKTLTYRELDERANKLAHYLGNLGVKSGTRVGICLERRIETLVGLLGIMKAGGTYLPLDPEFPAQRLQYMVDDAEIPILVTERELADAVPAANARTVFIDDDWPEIEKQPATRPNVYCDPGQLIYLIYTSGSTGQPKGVELPHRAVVNFLETMRQTPGLTAEDRLLAVTTLSFDIAVLEIYLPLICGGTTVLADKQTVVDGNALRTALAEHGITIMQATPSTWRLLLEAGWEGSPQLKALCGGEAMPADLAARLAPCVQALWNMYGPTETTVWSSCYRVPADGSRVCIGKPIGNTQIYILDRHRNPVQPGVCGNLFIGGDGLARGYRKRPDLTAERFVTDPFSDRPGARMYDTGDVARFARDGNIEYVGRADNQIKIRGFRIERGDIEAALSTHPAISQVAADVRSAGSDDQRLVGYYVSAPGQSATATDLRAHLRDVLPNYMVPQHFVELDAMPLTPNGKVDYKALPPPFAVTGRGSGEHVAPRSRSEAFVAAIWRNVLGNTEIGVNDNFFDLGGHSLLSMRVIARVREETGIRIKPRDMLFGTLEQIAAAVPTELINDADDVASRSSG